MYSGNNLVGDIDNLKDPDKTYEEEKSKMLCNLQRNGNNSRRRPV